MGGRIEPAEPEPPPAHSLGRVGEAAMGRLGQLVRPCWLDADGVAGGEELVARLVVRLVFSLFFFDIFGCLGYKKTCKIAESSQPKEKVEKCQKQKTPKKGENTYQKITKKSIPKKLYFFKRFWRFLDAKTLILEDFGSQK